MRRTQIGMMLWLGICTLSGGTSFATESYTITNLGSVNPTAINGQGQVVGYAASGGGGQQAFLWQPTVPNSSTGVTLSLNTPNLGGSSFATGINASGQIVGYATDSTATTANAYSFLFSPTANNSPTGSSVVLNVPPLDGSAGQFQNPSRSAINDSGEVVTDAGGITHATLFSPSTPNGNTGTVTQLPNQAGLFYGASSINNRGQFTGNFSSQEAGRFDPTTPNGVTGTYTTIVSPGQGGAALFDGVSTGISINSAGTIVGYGFRTTPTNQQQAVVWKTDGSVIDLNPSLGATNADATGINDANQIVGTADGHAFLYQEASGFNLNQLVTPASGWILESAIAINNGGEIIGVGQLNGVNEAFLLTPVPEPVSVGLAAIGISLLLRRARPPYFPS